jgi:hypothetical protein
MKVMSHDEVFAVFESSSLENSHEIHTRDSNDILEILASKKKSQETF